METPSDQPHRPWRRLAAASLGASASTHPETHLRRTCTAASGRAPLVVATSFSLLSPCLPPPIPLAILCTPPFLLILLLTSPLPAALLITPFPAPQPPPPSWAWLPPSPRRQPTRRSLSRPPARRDPSSGVHWETSSPASTVLTAPDTPRTHPPPPSPNPLISTTSRQHHHQLPVMPTPSSAPRQQSSCHARLSPCPHAAAPLPGVLPSGSPARALAAGSMPKGPPGTQS